MEEFENLQTQIFEAEKTLKNALWKKERKESAFLERIRLKDRQLEQIYELIERTELSIRDLDNSIQGIKKSSMKMNKGLLQLYNQAHNLCKAQVQEVVQHNIENYQYLKEKKLSKIQKHIDILKVPDREKTLKKMLDSIWNINPDLPHPLVDLHSVQYHLDDIHEFLETAISQKQEETFQIFDKKVQLAFPEIPHEEGETFETALNRHIKTIHNEKDKECQEFLRKADEREQFLHAKLDEALNKIQILQNAAEMQDFDVLNEVEEAKSTLDQSKRDLDEKIKQLFPS